MSATEVDLTDYRSFILCKLHFHREIVRVQLMSGWVLIQLPSINPRTSAGEMNTGFAR